MTRQFKFKTIRLNRETRRKFKQHPYATIMVPKMGPETEEEAHDQAVERGEIETEKVPLIERRTRWQRIADWMRQET